MSMYEQFQTDPDLEKNGIFIDYGEFRVTLARAGGANKQYAKLLEAKTKPYRRAIQIETMDNEKAMDLLLEAFAEAVVLNWEVKDGDKWKKGIEGPDGDVIPFNTDNVIKTLRALPDLFNDLQEQASKVALYRKSIDEDDAGN